MRIQKFFAKKAILFGAAIQLVLPLLILFPLASLKGEAGFQMGAEIAAVIRNLFLCLNATLILIGLAGLLIGKGEKERPSKGWLIFITLFSLFYFYIYGLFISLLFLNYAK